MTFREITFENFISENVKKTPDANAVFCDGVFYTYKELNECIDYFTATLIQKGVKKGDHVALWGYNSINWVISFYSIVRAGAVAVLLNYSSMAKDLEELVKFTNVKFIIYGNNREIKKNPDAAKILGSSVNLDSEKIIDIDSSVMDFKKLASESKIDLSQVKKLCASDDPHRTAVIIFTTGTTAMPKAVQLSQYGIVNDAISFGNRYEEIRGSKICVSLPLFHSYGLLVFQTYLYNGGTCFIHGSIKTDVIVNLIGEHQVSDIASVGSVYLGLVEHSDFDIKVMPNVRVCLIGGGVASPVQMMRLESCFKHGIMLHAYGQTESSPVLSVMNPNDPIEKRATTVGRPLDCGEIRIWLQDKGFLNSGEIGEVVARGAYLMNGYYGLPEDKQSIDKDGWLHTGDLGFLDEEGFLHLAGRIKDIIIINGENVSPIDVEQEINKDDAIREVKVLGAPNPITGESIEACIVLNKNAVFNEEFLRAQLKTKIAPFKIPSHFFVYDSFPVNANGKLDQRALKEDMLKRILKNQMIEALNTKGITVASITLKNSVLIISAVNSMIKNIADKIQFTESKTLQICLAVESMLNERILNAYVDVGNITVAVKLMASSFRLEFSDSGDKYFANKNAASNDCAQNILRFVDNFSIKQEEKGHSIYCMDFNYNNTFDVEKYLMTNY